MQTFNPEHYVFQMVQAQDYEGFYEREIDSRRRLGYPPFTRLALVRISGPNETGVSQQAQRLADSLRRVINKEDEPAHYIRVLGPAPAGLTKLKGRFRWQLLIKSYGRPALLAALRHARRLWSPPPKIKIELTLDIDPANFF